MTAPIVKPVRVEPPLGDRVVWTRRIVDAGGQSLGMLSGAPDAFVALLVEAVNDYLYDPGVLADMIASERTCQVPGGHIYGGEDAAGNVVCSFCGTTLVHPDGGWREAVEA